MEEIRRRQAFEGTLCYCTCFTSTKRIAYWRTSTCILVQKLRPHTLNKELRPHTLTLARHLLGTLTAAFVEEIHASNSQVPTSLALLVQKYKY
jgi:hypothetical protein